MAPPAEAARGGGGAALWLDLFFVSPLQPFPEGGPSGWVFTRFPPGLQL